MHLVEGNGHQEVAKGQRRHLWLSILQAWYAQQLLMSCHWARYRCQAHKQLHPACPLLSSCSQPIASIACTPWRPHCRRWSSELSHQEFQMSWQRSHGSRVTNLRLKVSRFHGWSLPYWLAPLPIAEILSHPGENSRAPRFSTCAERFPATDGTQQRPNWSRVETTYLDIWKLNTFLDTLFRPMMTFWHVAWHQGLWSFALKHCSISSRLSVSQRKCLFVERALW